jgi:hypothetical protein
MLTSTSPHSNFRQLLRGGEFKMIQALRSGGFTCFLPRLNSSGRLAGLPKRLFYVGGLLSLDCLRVIVAEYSPDPCSYIENDRFRELVYFSRDRSWFTALAYDKLKCRWHATKHVGTFRIDDRCRGTVLAYSDADTIEQLVVHATMIGPDPGEPAIALKDHDGEEMERIFFSTST